MATSPQCSLRPNITSKAATVTTTIVGIFFFFFYPLHTWFQLKSQWGKENSDFNHSGFSSDEEHFLSSEEHFPVICWAESSWKRLKLVSSVSKCSVQPLPMLWLQGESPWGRELDCYMGVLIDDMDEFDPRQRKFSSELAKWTHFVNLLLNGWVQSQATSCRKVRGRTTAGKLKVIP